MQVVAGSLDLLELLGVAGAVVFLGSRGGCNGGQQDTRHDGFPPISHAILPWLLKDMK